MPSASNAATCGSEHGGKPGLGYSMSAYAPDSVGGTLLHKLAEHHCGGKAVHILHSEDDSTNLKDLRGIIEVDGAAGSDNGRAHDLIPSKKIAEVGCRWMNCNGGPGRK